MVKLFPQAEFEADFPDDSEEDDGDIVVFPGRNVVEAISEILERAGHKCEPPFFGDFAWEAHVEFMKRSMVFGVHTFEPGEFHLFAKDASPLDRWFPSAKRKFVEYLRMLGRELGADARFRNLRWFSDKDGRHDHPVALPVEDA
jgi:hypothetical protein